MLPDEEKNLISIGTQFSQEFQTCARLLHVAYFSVFPELKAATSGHNPQTRAVVIGILVREIRRFRATVAMCQLGYVESAEILTRSLFEAFLAERYIFGDDLQLDKCSKHLRERRRELPDIPKSYCQQDFRALLYGCSRNFAVNAAGEKSRRYPEIKGLNRTSMQQVMKDIKKRIGPKWYAVLAQNPGGYSGMSVRQLAENSGHLKFYDFLYGTLSVTVHAADPLRHLDFNKSDGNWDCNVAGFDDGSLLLTLQLSCVLMGHLCDDLGQVFQLPCREKLQTLSAEIEAMSPSQTE